MQDTQARLRDQRKPGHGWFDNEIYDVFGDELQQDGISVYMTLARLCYGALVKKKNGAAYGLRELAANARMGKDTFARTLKRVVALGLVVEHKGRTAQSPSTYDLVDVKELAAEYMREAVKREKAAVEEKRRLAEAERKTVSTVDSSRDVTLVDLLKSSAVMVMDEVTPHDAAKCLSVRQSMEQPDSVDKKICAEPVATDVSQKCTSFATEVSHDLRHLRQDTRHKTQHTTPQPPVPGGELPEHLKTGCLECAAVAVARVMRECGLSEPRPGRGVSRAIRAAMEMHLERADAPDGGWQPDDFDRIADRMVKAYALFLEEADLMAFRVGAPKFFAEGWWNDRARWPYDPKLLDRARRRL